VEAVVLTLADGEAAVYAGHSPFTAPVVSCELRFKEEGEWKRAFIAGGILEVKQHKTVLLSDAAEWPEEIDRERAQEEKDRALKTLSSGAFQFEVKRAQESLKRAEIRLKVSGAAG
jgi:F-type H+-transporting ATPase subunit epsilon